MAQSLVVCCVLSSQYISRALRAAAGKASVPKASHFRCTASSIDFIIHGCDFSGKYGAPERNVRLRCVNDFTAELPDHSIGNLGLNDGFPIEIGDRGL